jgi:hypothetical protein
MTINEEDWPSTLRTSGYLRKTFIGSWMRRNNCLDHVILPATCRRVVSWAIQSCKSYNWLQTHRWKISLYWRVMLKFLVNLSARFKIPIENESSKANLVKMFQITKKLWSYWHTFCTASELYHICHWDTTELLWYFQIFPVTPVHELSKIKKAARLKESRAL